MRRDSSTRRASRYSPQKGYALLLMLVLVAMGILFSVVNQVSLVGKKVARAEGTSAALLQAKEALIGYAATYRDTHPGEIFGYLPCPDQTSPPTELQGNGVAENACGTSGQTVAGLLPYRTLGLEDLRDSSGICLWYVVSGTFKNSPKAAVPMNWDTQGMIAVLDTGGTTISAPDDINGGAAAVIIATGIALAGQSRSTSSNTCGVVPSQVSAYIESAINPTGTSTLAQGSNATNNDQILAITSREIFNRITSRADFSNPLTANPVGQINDLSNKIRIALETQIQSDLLATGTPTSIAQPDNQSGYSQFSGKLIGDLPAALSLGSTSDNNWLDNWNDQYRYAACSDLTTTCLSIAGTSCRAALLFAGKSTAGGPRSSAQKPPAVLPTPPNTYLANYFENVSSTPSDPHGALDLLSAASATFSSNGRTAYTTNLPSSADVGTCLFPGTFLSFAKNIGSFSSELAPTPNPTVSINTAAQTITLGNPSATAASSGCAWSSVQPFTTSMRAYFRFRIADRGEGFVFAIADAARNNLSGTLCGGNGNSLGYAGSGINYPKLGLEIDTRRSTARADPGTNARPDHLAFLYWGTTASPADDNNHGVPAATSINGNQPLNPRGLGTLSIQSATWSANVVTITTSATHYLIPNQNVTISGVTPAAYNGTYQVTPINATRFSYALTSNPGLYASGGIVVSPFYGIATVRSSDTHLPHDGVLPTNTDIHVRMDITKNHVGSSGTYDLKAYVISVPDSCTSIANLRNLSFDMDDLSCNPAPAPSPSISQERILINDISGFGEALSSVYVGFTNGQATDDAGEQSIIISDFLFRSR